MRPRRATSPRWRWTCSARDRPRQADAIITELGKMASLRVISRQSTLRFRGASTPLAEIARNLRVDAIVEGSVQRDGARVRLTAQLIEADPENGTCGPTATTAS